MSELPDKIYLQIGEFVELDDDFDIYDSTWHDERTFPNDIEYSRTLPPEAERVIEAAKEYASGGYEDSHTLHPGSIGEYMELFDAIKAFDQKETS